MQLLVRNVTNGTGAEQYKRGDIVVVMPDDHVWGRKEVMPNFVICKLRPPITALLTSPLRENNSGNSSAVTGRRRYGVSEGILDNAGASGSVEIVVADIIDKAL